VEIKRKGDVICEKYKVVQVFPFIYGVFYLVKNSADFSMSPSIRLVHAVKLQQNSNKEIKESLMSRNEEIFYPIANVFIQDGVVYQLYEKIEGHMLEMYLLEEAPLKLGEAAHIMKMVTSHLMKCYDQGEFALVDPQNIIITPQGKVKFLYGGPNGLLPHHSTEDARNGHDEREDVRQAGQLFYMMLSNKYELNQWDDPRVLQRIEKDLPPNLKMIFGRTQATHRLKRPRIHELWKVAYEYAEEKPMLGIHSSRSFISSELTQPLHIVQKEKKKSWPNKITPSRKNTLSRRNTARKKLEKRKKSIPKPLILLLVSSLCVSAFIFSIIKIHSVTVADHSLENIIYSDISSDEEQAAIWYQDSLKALDRKDLKQATVLARKALSADLDQAEYYLHLANLYGEAKDYKSGVLTLTAASKKFPQDAGVFDALAVHAYYAKDYTTAQKASEKAVELDNKDPRYLYHQAKVYAALKQYTKAVNILTYAIYMHQDQGLYYHDLAVFLTHLDRLDDGIDYARMAVKYDPGEPHFQVTLGALYLMKREEISKDQTMKDEDKKELLDHWATKAKEVFEGITKQNQKLPEAWYYQSQALYYLDEKELANQAALSAVRLDSQNTDYLYQLGLTYLALEKKPDAISVFRKITFLDPKNKMFQEGLKKAETL
jgi:tetratricopeptide (TPR) repeat protein